MLRTIYELDDNRVFTGQSKVIQPNEGRPINWILSEVAPPQGVAQWQGDWVLLAEYPTKPPDEIINKATLQIDADVDVIYQQAIGNRLPEYTLAETSAQAFADAGYTGDVPAAVQSWATAKGWTAQVAADDILLAAENLRTAQNAIRAQRLLRKEQVKAATNADQVAQVLASWAGFVGIIKGQLGL